MSASIILLVPFWILFLRLGITFSFTLTYYGVTESFPPLYMSTVFAFWHIWAKTSTVFAPMVAEIVEQPIIIIALLSIAGLIASTFLSQPKQKNEMVHHSEIIHDSKIQYENENSKKEN